MVRGLNLSALTLIMLRAIRFRAQYIFRTKMRQWTSVTRLLAEH
jgi:hypothetical protein